MQSLYKRILACVALILMQSGHAEDSRQLEFEVLLDARPVGTHRFLIQDRADGYRQVESLASFDVRWLGFTALRYRHEALERWKAGCLESIEAITRENGRLTAVRGARQGQLFALRTPVERAEQDSCVSSYAYWDGRLLLAERILLNPQTGESDKVRFEALGNEVIEVMGASQPAQRYRLHSERLQIDLWYSATGEWLALESQVGGGRTLRYRLKG